MPTARDIITLAMKEAGVLGVGQTLLAEDVNDGFTLLQNMLAQWQKRRWIVPSLMDIKAIGNSEKSNPIGPGQYWNYNRPDKIQAAYFVQLNNNTSANPVSFRLRQIWSYEDYANLALKELESWAGYFFYDNAFPYGNVFVWPIPNENIEVHLIVKSPIGFSTQIAAVEKVTNGTAYTDGVYLDIPFITLTGYGIEGTADVTVAGGVVTIDAIHTPGDGYNLNDMLTLDTALMGGTGVDFVCKITGVVGSLDSELNMPAEYQEAIHYNLCVRLTSMYQLEANPVQGQLAKLALNTIKNSNTQVPTLIIPGRKTSFYIFSADAR